MDNKREALPSILHPLAHHHVGQCDCDCACALDLPAGPPAQSAPGLWTRQVQARPFALDDGWQAYLNPIGPVGVTALNPAAQRLLAAFESPVAPDQVTGRLPGMPVAALQDAVDGLARTGLLHPVEGFPWSSTGPSTLSAWLHVTKACNLNCAYCYVYKRPGAMSLETARRAIDRLVEMAGRHGYTTLKLKYAGGEPTLAFPLLQAIHAYAARHAAGAGLALEEALLTNGVRVTDPVLDFVARAGMRLMVSLDGGPDAHDQARAGRDGACAYAAVADTVERALERGVRPNISITLTALNLDGAAEAVAFALERDLAFNLNFYRECSSAGREGLPSPLAPDPARLIGAMHRIFDVIRSYPAYPLPLTGILDRTRLDIPHHYPCSAGRDYVAVGTDGQVSACQMLLEQPWSNLTADDPLSEIRQRGQGIFQAVEEHPECRTCPWRTACSGGCPLMRQTALHDGYCRVYRTLFPDLIRLEGNRLVAVQS